MGACIQRLEVCYVFRQFRPFLPEQLRHIIQAYRALRCCQETFASGSRMGHSRNMNGSYITYVYHAEGKRQRLFDGSFQQILISATDVE